MNNQTYKTIAMKSIYILLLLTISVAAFAQKSTKVMEKSVFEAMDARAQSDIDDKMNQARESFKKILSKNPEDVLAIFGLSIVYGYDSYSKKDYFEAWKYFQEAEKKQAQFTEEDKGILDQYFFKEDKKRRYKPINKNMEWERARVEDKLIKYVREENKLELANRFLEEFPDSRFYENVIHIRNYIEYRTAENTNTVAAYEAFLKKYPESAQVKIATKNRNKLAYDKAVATKSLNALQNFINTYPNAVQVEEAKKLMGVYAFNDAVKQNTLEAIEAFMENYPNSSKMPEAKVIKRKLLFAWAKSVNTLEAYNKFVSQYPEGEMYIDIFNLKANALGEQIRVDFPFENYGFIKGFDNNQIDDFGGDVALRPNGEILLVGNSKKTAEDPDDVWMLGLDTQGKMNWNTIIGNDYDDKVNTVIVNNKNEIFAAGTTNAHGDSIPGRAWIFKLDPDGKNVYNRTLDGTEIQNFELYNDGKALVLGTAFNCDDSINYTYLMRVNENGRKLWDRSYNHGGKLQDFVINTENIAFVASQHWLFALDDRGYLKWDKIIEDSATFFNAVCLSSDNKVIYSGVKGNDLYATAFDFEGNTLWETTFERLDLATISETLALSDNHILVCSETRDKKLIISKIDASGKFIANKTFSLPGGLELNGITAIENNQVLVSITTLNQKDLIVFKLGF